MRLRSRRSPLLALSCALTLVACGNAEQGGTGSGGGGTGTGTPPENAPRHHGLTEAEAAETLVKVGDRTITVGEFADRLAEQSPYLRARYNSPERRREFLDNLIRFELLANEARRRGYDQLPEVQHTRKQLMIQEMMQAEFENRIQLTDITDDEVRAYYDAHQDEFHKAEQVRASHILIRDRAAAQRVLNDLIEKQADVNFFREQAERFNEDPETRDRFGDLRFFSRPADRTPDEPVIPEAVANAAFAIEQIGTYAPALVEAPDGFHIVKLTGRRAALHRTLEEASRPIRNRLWRERREQAVEALITQLRGEADVQIDLSALEQIHVDLPPAPADAGPPAAPATPAAPPAGEGTKRPTRRAIAG